MARRRASRKKGSSSNPMIVGGGIAAVLIIVVAIFVFQGKEKTQAGTDIPLDILAMNASQLSNNYYSLDGTVTDRFPRGSSELISFLYKDSSGKEYIIPICVPEEAKDGLKNIERNQQYRIEFRVEDISPTVRGVCVAKSIQINK